MQERAIWLDGLAKRTDEPVDRLEEWRALGLIGMPAGSGFSVEDVERVRLIQSLLRRGIALDVIAVAARSGRFDRWLQPYFNERFKAGRIPTYPLADAAAAVGLDQELARRLWEVAATDERGDLLDDEDLEMLRMSKFVLDWDLPADALVQLWRVYADAMGRVAEVTLRLFHLYVHERFKTAGMSEAELRSIGRERSAQLAPLADPALRYFHTKGQIRAAREDVVLHLAEEVGMLSIRETPGEVIAAILFVDLASFTSLAEAMGDVKAAEVLERFGALVREVANRSAGQVVKQIGDAFMLVFQEPRSAVACAVDLERRASREPNFPATRSGVHWGRMLYRDGDYVGTAVNLAARVAAAARRHQVLVTSTVRREAGGVGNVEFVGVGVRQLKGITEEVELFEAKLFEHAAPERSVDPVCGMELAETEVVVRLSLEGAAHVFCSEECLRRYVSAPAKYRHDP
jgi:adenylate cyclase